MDPQSLFMFAAIGFLIVLMVMQSRKRKKQAEELANSLSVGVWVMLTSGIYGEIVAINEDRVSLRVGEATILVAKGAVMRTVEAPAEAVVARTSAKKLEGAAKKSVAAKKTPAKPATKSSAK